MLGGLKAVVMTENVQVCLKITPVFLMVLPGVIGYVLLQKGAIHLANVAGKGSSPRIAQRADPGAQMTHGS